MENEQILEFIQNLSPGKKKYEEKRAKKLNYNSLYDYILSKFEKPKQNIKTEDDRCAKHQSISSRVKKTPPKNQIENLYQHYQNGQFKDAENLALIITKKYPKHQFAWKVLGVILKESGRVVESLLPNQESVKLAPEDAIAQMNLGSTLQELGKLEEAEVCFRKAIILKPDNAYAYYNMGVTLKELGRFEEAAENYEQALIFNPNYFEAYCNLGALLQELGKLEKAEISCRKAISLKPNYAEAHHNLGVVLYSKGNIDKGIDSLVKANTIDPNSRESDLVLSVLQGRKTRMQTEIKTNNSNDIHYKLGLKSNPFFLKRKVEPELIMSLSQLQSRKMDEAKNTPVFGNGRCSLDYNMFDQACPSIKNLETDLTELMKSAVNSDIYIYDSFFNIYGAGAGIPPHTHLSAIDKDKYLNLAKQKYSLVYYVSVGDQNCSEPGFFKLYDPEEQILPSNGMVIIIPADRVHSAVYNGTKDRIIIGINFYCL